MNSESGVGAHGEQVTLRVIRVFLASPGDVVAERKLARKVLRTLQNDPLSRRNILIEEVAWDTPGRRTPMPANMLPQEAIATELTRPSQCDFVVVILWSRLGTPLPENAEGEFIKADGSRYLSGTEWEFAEAMRGAREQRRPQVLVYRRTEEPHWGARDPERSAKQEQWDRLEAFLDTFTNPDGSIKAQVHEYDGPAAFEDLLEEHLRARIGALLAETGPQAVEIHSPGSPLSPGALNDNESIEKWTRSPFPGLNPFTEADAPIYFGRTSEIDGLIRCLANPDVRFVAVVGASGSGKSSLVAAGLIPHLRIGAIEGSANWVFPRPCTPGEADDPFIALAYALQPLVANASVTPREIAGRLRIAEERRGVVADILQDRPDGAELFIFIDQCEELFTISTAEHATGFASMLLDLAVTKQARVIITLRSDFYPNCLDVGFSEALRGAGTFPLDTASQVAMRSMTIQPAARVGLVFDEGLVDQIVEDAGAMEGNLSQLAFSLAELYHRRTSSGRMTFDAYREFGGVQGAIARRAEATFDSLSNDAKATLMEVFRHLVQVDESGKPIRRQVPKDQVEESESVRELVHAFIGARLLVAGTNGPTPTIGVAHDALFTRWPMLAQWIEERRGDLTLLWQVRWLAREWDASGRNPSLLRPHEWLSDVHAMLGRLRPRDLTDVDRAYIRPEADRLQDELNAPATDHMRRAEIGDRLARIGDPRPGVGLRSDGLPMIEWCVVPSNTTMIPEDEDPEDPKVVPMEYEVATFHIAKYAVTWEQFRAFVTASDGYDNAQWWVDLEKPGRDHDQYRRIANHPVENVTWGTAVAFCRWLTVRLRAVDELPEGDEIRLPAEWEWQVAARDVSHSGEFPWKDGWDPRLVNSRESRLGRTVAVGMYPGGASLCGALDMAGNVSEWCLNVWYEPYQTDIAVDGRRAVRGGSFSDEQNLVRVVTQADSPPHTSSDFIGFRICRSPSCRGQTDAGKEEPS